METFGGEWRRWIWTMVQMYLPRSALLIVYVSKEHNAFDGWRGDNNHCGAQSVPCCREQF